MVLKQNEYLRLLKLWFYDSSVRSVPSPVKESSSFTPLCRPFPSPLFESFPFGFSPSLFPLGPFPLGAFLFLKLCGKSAICTPSSHKTPTSCLLPITFFQYFVGKTPFSSPSVSTTPFSLIHHKTSPSCNLFSIST